MRTTYSTLLFVIGYHTRNYSKLLPIGNQPLPQQQFCLHLNVSQCDVSEAYSRFVVTAYNPRSQEVTNYVRLPVRNGVYTVLDPDGIQTIYKHSMMSLPMAPFSFQRFFLPSFLYRK